VEHDTPILVAGLPPAMAVSAGAEHTCALLTSGDVMCWGDDSEAELGDGLADGGVRYVPTPVKVVGLPP
jgi:alpha-tubulin suppressor-like RCC1 family protein